jgi:phage protein D
MLKPGVRLFLENENITNDIVPDLIDLEYNNNGDNASTLRLTVRSSPRLFNASWIPKPLQYLKCEFFYQGSSSKLNAGNFQVESIQEDVSNNHDTLEISAISVPITGRIFEKKNLSFKNTLLKTILQDKALGLGLNAQIQVPELFVNVEQQEQSDLEFLRSIASSWGLNFTIDNGTLVMASDSYLRSMPAILDMSRSEYQKLKLEHTGYNTYADCEVTYNWLGEQKELIVKDWAVFTDNLFSLRSSRRLRHEMKFPIVSPYHAAYAGLERLIRTNNGQINGEMQSIGRPELVALNNINVAGNRFNGKYQIEQAVHTFDADNGWKCNCKLRWIPVRAGGVQFTWYDMLEIARGSIAGFGIDIPGIPGI